MIVDGIKDFENDDLARPASPSHSTVKHRVASALSILVSNSASPATYASVHHTIQSTLAHSVCLYLR